MPMNTSDVGRAFWSGRAATGSSVSSSGDKLFSYGTVILQRLSNGQTIGNVTKYSTTTSKHQSQTGVRMATRTVSGVPRGATDLRPYLKRKKR
jgi:hypothetical protein